jgi:hypothetical protein
MDDLLREFVTETNEDSRVIRLVHTIKGTCGFWLCPRRVGSVLEIAAV